MKFVLEINLGNDAMNSSEDLAQSLRRIAERVADNRYVEELDSMGEEISRGVLDANGTKVGDYSFFFEDEKKED